MKKMNEDYLNFVNMDDEKHLFCRCGEECDVIHVSNHHDGTGMFYMKCPKCGREHNASWKIIPTLTPTETEKKS